MKASPFSAAVLGREFLCPRLLFVVLVPLFDFTAYGKNSARDGGMVGGFFFLSRHLPNRPPQNRKGRLRHDAYNRLRS
jgi:hypothetical protein